MMGDPNQPDYSQIYIAEEDDRRRRLEATSLDGRKLSIYESTLQERLGRRKLSGAIDVIDDAGNWLLDNWFEAPGELTCSELRIYVAISMLTTIIMVALGPTGYAAFGVAFATNSRKMAVSTVSWFGMYVIRMTIMTHHCLLHSIIVEPGCSEFNNRNQHIYSHYHKRCLPLVLFERLLILFHHARWLQSN